MAKKKKKAKPGAPVFQYRTGFSAPVDPQVAGEWITALQNANGGFVTPEQVVEAARPVDSPVHAYFEWRQDVAARLYNEEQAKRLIAAVRVVDMNPETKVANLQVRNVHVTHETKGSCYATIDTAFDDPEMKKQVINEALRGYLAMMRRYEHIMELDALHTAMLPHLPGQ